LAIKILNKHHLYLLFSAMPSHFGVLRWLGMVEFFYHGNLSKEPFESKKDISVFLIKIRFIGTGNGIRFTWS
jgi:hypothetical protein